MKDFPVTKQRPDDVGQGLDPTKDARPELMDQAHQPEASDEHLQKAKATPRAFVIRLYVTSAIVMTVLSFAIYLMMRLS